MYWICFLSSHLVKENKYLHYQTNCSVRSLNSPPSAVCAFHSYILLLSCSYFLLRLSLFIISSCCLLFLELSLFLELFLFWSVISLCFLFQHSTLSTVCTLHFAVFYIHRGSSGYNVLDLRRFEVTMQTPQVIFFNLRHLFHNHKFSAGTNP